MTGRQEPYYVDYEGDFGLSGLTEAFALASAPRDTGAALGLVTATLDAYDLARPLYDIGDLGAEQRTRFGYDTCHDEWGYADDLREDVRALVASPLADETIRTVWRAASGDRWDPAAHGLSARDWLRHVEETCAARPHRKIPGPRPEFCPIFGARPPRPDEVRDDVLAEIRFCRERTAAAPPSADTLTALEEVAATASPAVAFRLLLRALKVHSVRIDKPWYDRLEALSSRFEHCTGLVEHGLDIAWPPIDTARRDSTWDFGFSGLARSAHQDWSGSREEIHDVAAGDSVGQTRGSAAAVLLEDTLRLLGSALSDTALATLWDGASGEPRRVGGRDWLRLVADVCRERLAEAAPAYTPVVAPARTELADVVLREIRETVPAVADRVVCPYRCPVPAGDVMDLLEQVVTRIDPDLGFRLFLRVLSTLAVPLTRERYDRYRAIGERIGYGEFHVSDVEYLVDAG
ncbi:hypothetical protein [Streptomyces sp. NPDC001068]|uniref:hypothetical protein n=1 Tax=Streptomyces sp. NPDC001068 TaxID=3364544 RepID=UPI0036D041CA